MTQLDFSIIIPTYDRPGELLTCLRSLAALDYPADRFEAIIVDDGGRISPAPVVSHFSDGVRIRVVCRENGGPAAARNTGAQVAAGRILAFTDDDCVPEPDWLSALGEPLRAEPEVMVGGRVINSLTGNPYSAASQIILDLVYAYYNADPNRARFFATNNMAVSTDLFRAMGGFNARFRTSEDRDLCDRWLSAGRRLVFAPHAVIRHSHNLTLRGFWMQHIGYGRGARRFHQAHRRRNPSRSTFDGGFYAAALRRLPRLMSGRRDWPWLACLVVVWQAANLAGYAEEMLLPASHDLGDEGDR
ncbi:MAG: glycosyltransferase [Acidobacteriota bacterium]